MLGTVGLKLEHRCSCGTVMPLKVLNTPAGYYLGYWCPSEGPYSRETDYMTKENAELYLSEIKSVMEALFIQDEIIDSIV